MTLSQDLVKGWINVFTRFHKIPVFPRVIIFVSIMLIYTALVYWLEENSFNTKLLSEADSAIYSSVLLGLLLVFRTNSAYDRWWEGRKLWGQLVNDSRNLSIKVAAFVSVSQEEKIQFGKLLVAFAYAFKEHLREGVRPEELGEYACVAESVEHVPARISEMLVQQIETWRKDGKLESIEMLQMDPHIRGLLDVCGGCERIKSSPISISYRAFLRQVIGLNLLALPWYLIPEFQLLSIPLILIASYFLIGMELIAEDVEEPFGRGGDDLPLDKICATIKASVHEILAIC